MDHLFIVSSQLVKVDDMVSGYSIGHSITKKSIWKHVYRSKGKGRGKRIKWVKRYNG